MLDCLGTWVARCALDDGDEVIGFDLGENRDRQGGWLVHPAPSSESRRPGFVRRAEDQLVKDLRMIYTAPSEEAARAGLETIAGFRSPIG